MPSHPCRFTGLLAAAALVALAPPVGRADDDRCHEGAAAGGAPRLRMTLLKVELEDANGRLVDGIVEVDGVAVGATGKALRVPLCARHLRVTSAGRSADQALELRENDFSTFRVRLGALTPPVPSPTPGVASPVPPLPRPAPAASPSAGGSRATVVAELKLPAGMAAIHYHRPDGNYAGWGLHTWTGGEGLGKPLPGVTWGTPMEPSGRDEFGVYWLLPVKFYADGRVNFIIHDDTSKDCDQDTMFQLKQSREAWVVAGSCDPILTRRKAQEATKR